MLYWAELSILILYCLAWIYKWRVLNRHLKSDARFWYYVAKHGVPNLMVRFVQRDDHLRPPDDDDDDDNYDAGDHASSTGATMTTAPIATAPVPPSSAKVKDQSQSKRGLADFGNEHNVDEEKKSVAPSNNRLDDAHAPILRNILLSNDSTDELTLYVPVYVPTIGESSDEEAVAIDEAYGNAAYDSDVDEKMADSEEEALFSQSLIPQAASLRPFSINHCTEAQIAFVTTPLIARRIVGKCAMRGRKLDNDNISTILRTSICLFVATIDFHFDSFGIAFSHLFVILFHLPSILHRYYLSISIAIDRRSVLIMAKSDRPSARLRSGEGRQVEKGRMDD